MLRHALLGSIITVLFTDGGFGGTETQVGAGGDREAADTREAQNYGPGSDVGA